MRANQIIILCGIILIVGCRSEQTPKNRGESDSINFEYDSLRKEFKEVYYRFPSPDEMFSYLESTGLQFDRSLLHTYKDIDTYIETFDQAMNMGIYTADLAYISMFKRYKESMDYLQTIYVLSDRLRISSAFDKKLIFRVENNIKNNDSLEVISDIALNNIINYLSKNGKEDVFALISMGGFIEFMNITLILSGEYSANNLSVKKIADQKVVYDNILKFSQRYESESNVSKMLDLVQPLTDFYSGLKTETVTPTAKKDSGGKLIFSGSKKIHISGEEFQELRDIVADIRSKIIEAKI